MGGAPGDWRRELLLDLYRSALSAVDGRRRVRAALSADQDARPVSILAVGKAGSTMAQGALDALGARVVRGLVVAPDDGLADNLRAYPQIVFQAGDHPMPGERSLAAGNAALSFAGATPAGSRVLLLVSGGASALFEVLGPGVSLAELQRLNEWGHAAAVDIATLNAKRAALSLVKGGRLPRLFRDCDVEGLMISDVPDDDPAVLGSGLLASPQCRVTLVGCLDDALDAALRAARARGLDPKRAAARLSGEAAAAARTACREFAVGGANLQLWGGETVVRLPARPGRGGRCQHFALSAAQQIAGHRELLVLAAGTDGRDGASEDAGAIVDGDTLARAREAGYDAEKCLAAADSGSLLEAAGDLIYTGPTGTNVGDLVMMLRLE
jgi:hydroxypyruvate reductase